MLKNSWFVLSVALLAGGLPRITHACGVWSLKDEGLGRVVTFYVENTLISPPKGKRGPRAMILRLAGSSAATLHSVIGRRPDLQFKDGALRRRGKALGTIDGDKLTLGQQRYTISLTDRLAEWGPMHRWEVKVLQGERLIAGGKAMSLCIGTTNAPPPGERGPKWLAVEQEEIRRRVVLYLAWRQLLRRPGQ